MQKSQLAFSSHQRNDWGLRIENWGEERKSEERRRRKTKEEEGWLGFLKKELTLCPWSRGEHMPFRPKNNIIFQKMHITCNYKGWEVYWAMCKIHYRLGVKYNKP